MHNKRINSILNLTTENDDMSSKNAVSRNTIIRLYIILTIILISYFVIIFRLVDVSIMHDPEISSLNSFLHDVKPRGTIYDRNGLTLATNLPTKSVYAKPDQISDIYGVSKAIAEIMQKYSDKPT